jgi:hypothetical protein
MKIQILINDSRVWNPMQAAAEILLALQKHDNIVIDLMEEAPTLSETELPAFFDLLKDNGVDLKRITIHTGNLKENLSGPNIQHCPAFMYELIIFQTVAAQLPKTKNIKYHFGNLIGRCTWPRLALGSFLYDCHRERTFQTFHWSDKNDYHKPHLSLEGLIHEYGINSIEFAQAEELLKNSPLLQDEVTYPIIHPQNIIQPGSWYKHFFVDVVCETWYQGNNFFLTEKFWRAVATRTPFIIHGPQYILENLKKLGFQTFGNYWDEGYDEDPGSSNITGIKSTINFIASHKIEELNKMYTSMQPILENNYQVFANLKYDDFSKITAQQCF